ncbi:MAG: phosphoadenosine phosphosulfate reductase [Pseudomonadota bacterium]
MMVAGAQRISAELSEPEWLDALRRLGDAKGSYSQLGDHHSAVFVEQKHSVLFVTFETVFGIRSGSESGLPLAFDLCERRDWSHMTVIAQTQSWFRNDNVFGFFDRLVDYDFFDQFDRVIFYGAGMCGYAAAAFSVAAPGATVLTIAPQATLERSVTQWDKRFPNARRMAFDGRYADAAHLVAAAEAALVLYDPNEAEDAMHASLFRGDHVIHQRYRRGSAGAIEADLRSMSLIGTLAEAAAEDRLTAPNVASILRARRRHVPYLRALLSRVLTEERPELTRRLCRAVLAHQPLPRFQHHLESAEVQLGLRDRPPNNNDLRQDGS